MPINLFQFVKLALCKPSHTFCFLQINENAKLKSMNNTIILCTDDAPVSFSQLQERAMTIRSASGAVKRPILVINNTCGGGIPDVNTTERVVQSKRMHYDTVVRFGNNSGQIFDQTTETPSRHIIAASDTPYNNNTHCYYPEISTEKKSERVCPAPNRASLAPLHASALTTSKSYVYSGALSKENIYAIFFIYGTLSTLQHILIHD